MRKTFTRSLFLTALLGWQLGAAPLQAQTLDPAFQATMLKTPLTLGLQLTVNALAVQPDGKVLAAGGFDFVNGALTGKLQRFNADGTVDASFNAGGLGANGFLAAIVLQPDGKMLVGGGFTLFNGQVQPMVVRLNANGSLDPTFTFGSAASVRQIGSLALQPDGKILVGGGASFEGPQTGGLVRLLPSGALDSSFSIGAGATGGVVSNIVVQPDGRILIGGSFFDFNGQPVFPLLRLTSTGTQDPTFTAAINSNSGTVSSLTLQTDGKLLVGGTFTPTGTTGLTRLTRLQADGTLDTAFQPGTGPNGSVRTIKLESDGDILIGGLFTQVNGVSRGRVARLTSSGTLDASFAAGAGASNTVNFLAVLPSGKVLAAGGFPQYDGTSQGGLVQLSAATGQPDATFSPLIEARGTISQAAPLSNGQLLVSGNFTQFNGQSLPDNSLAVRRLNADGTLDQSFVSQATTAGLLQGVRADGSFYVVGTQLSTPTLQRVLASGTVDNNFAVQAFGPATGGIERVAQLQGVVPLANGQVLVFGRFTNYGSLTGTSGILRLNANGTPDNSFVPPTAPATRRITKVLVQPGGKLVLVSDEFPTSANLTITRLNADGTADNTFVGPSAATTGIGNVLMQPDGRLLVSGGFTSYNGQPAPYGLTRLTVDGNLDPSYSGVTASYLPYTVQPDGRLLASATSNIVGRAQYTLQRLNLDGSPDASFTPVAVPQSIFTGDDVLSGVAVQPTDGKLVLFGSFRYVAGQVRLGLARLTNTLLSTRAAGTIRPLLLYPNPAHETVAVQLPAATQPRPATLTDLTGRSVRRWTVPPGQTEARFSLEAVPAGLYLLQVQAQDGMYQQKLVVR